MNKMKNANDVNFRLTAQQAHEVIKKSWEEIKNRWPRFIQKVIAFKQQEFYLGVMDPRTGGYFTSFADWCRFMFGKAPSGIYRDIQIALGLDGFVSEHDLGNMPKANAKALRDLVASGRPLTPEDTAKAQELPVAEFKKWVNKKIGRTSEEKPMRQTIGPYRVRQEVAERFQQAMMFAHKAAQGSDSDYSRTERALLAISNAFLAANTKMYVEAAERAAQVPGDSEAVA